MTYYTEVSCKNCSNQNIKIIGHRAHGVPRYRCYNKSCSTKTFMLEYRYKAYVTGVKEQAVEMAINGSGIRDTSRVLGVSKSTVISTLKNKENRLVQVNPKIDTLSLGLRVANEVFADRLYLSNGRLAPREQGLTTDCQQSLEQVRQMIEQNSVSTIDGQVYAVQADTLCIHGDSKDALVFAETVSHWLEGQNVSLSVSIIAVT